MTEERVRAIVREEIMKAFAEIQHTFNRNAPIVGVDHRAGEHIKASFMRHGNSSVRDIAEGIMDGLRESVDAWTRDRE